MAIKKKEGMEGVWDGARGWVRDDGVYDGVREITLIYNSICIHSLLVVYDKNGKPFTTYPHGGPGGDTRTKITLSYPNEYLTRVSGTIDRVFGGLVIVSLKFTTNQRVLRDIGPRRSQKSFDFSCQDGARIVGFKVGSDAFVKDIRFHQATPTARPGSSIGVCRLIHQKLKERLTRCCHAERDDHNITAQDPERHDHNITAQDPDQRDDHNTTAQDPERDDHNIMAQDPERHDHNITAQDPDQRDDQNTTAQDPERDGHNTTAQDPKRDGHNTTAQDPERDGHNITAQDPEQDGHNITAQDPYQRDDHNITAQDPKRDDNIP